MNKILIILAFLALYGAELSAQTFTTGYSSYLVFSNNHTERPVGETEIICEENTRRAIRNYLGMFPAGDVVLDESRSLPCGPMTSTVPDLDVKAWRLLPIPPVCLSCPYLHPGSFEIYYPDFVPEIKSLYYQYSIDKYNQELLSLQQKYQLESFEKELFNLNNEINIIKK